MANAAGSKKLPKTPPKTVRITASNLTYAAADTRTLIPTVDPTIELQSELTSTLSENYEVEVISNTDSYQKFKFTNNETKVVEYVEIENIGDVFNATVIFGDNEVNFSREGNIVSEHDIKNNSIKTTYLSNQYSKSSLDTEIGTMGYDDDTRWKFYFRTKSSTALAYNEVGYIAALLATYAKHPIIGLFTAAATYYVNRYSKFAWYILDTYTWKDSYYYLGHHSRYYGYPDYTNKLTDTWSQPNGTGGN